MNRAFLIIAIWMNVACWADLNDDLNKFFNDFGSSANVNSAEIYEGQKAGYVTGGGITIRNRVMNSKIASVSMPEWDAGCGGIDIYGGGFSYINSDRLVQTLKSIGSGSIGYAFMLGMESVSPQLASVMKQLNTWVENVNSTNINSCELAAQATGSVWPRKWMARQNVCKMLGMDKGMFSDYLAARNGCAETKQYEQTVLNIDGNKNLLPDEHNIAWEVMKKQSLLMADQDLAELFMTLTGTVVISKKSIQSFPSKITDENFLYKMLEGGELSLYSCQKDTKRCLIVTERKEVVRKVAAWKGKINLLLSNIQRKILQDVELSNEEKEVLTNSRLPLYKIVNVLTAYKKGYCPVELREIADIVAIDLLFQYFREVIELVRDGASQLKRGQMYSDAVDEYLENLNRVEGVVRHYEERIARDVNKEFQLIQKIQMLEEQIALEIRI